MSIKVLLADDHQMMRDGLRAIIEQVANVEIIGEAADGREAVILSGQLGPDIIVMDISMPGLNGIEATRRITTEYPDVKVIALSMHSDKRYALEMLDAGASGYVLKGAASEELVRALEAVTDGKSFLSPEITGIVMGNYVRRNLPGGRSPTTSLGPREREVLQLLSEGKTSTLIADSLHISSKTVDTHRRNIMHKLDIHSIAGLTRYAIREGLTSLES